VKPTMQMWLALLISALPHASGQPLKPRGPSANDTIVDNADDLRTALAVPGAVGIHLVGRISLGPEGLDAIAFGQSVTLWGEGAELDAGWHGRVLSVSAPTPRPACCVPRAASRVLRPACCAPCAMPHAAPRVSVS
jgi:hypothetical protein